MPGSCASMPSSAVTSTNKGMISSPSWLAIIPRTSSQSIPPTPLPILGIAMELNRSLITNLLTARNALCPAILFGRLERPSFGSAVSLAIRFKTLVFVLPPQSHMSPGSGFVSSHHSMNWSRMLRNFSCSFLARLIRTSPTTSQIISSPLSALLTRLIGT